ncbi:unnamed protein product [Phytophthora lilii]|uniref:Unnamed protein product n=1 Tax=Phytophthora lilii TaxID=2077276 RepID=A0A9W6UCY0_9STRA|nr:unnamed protein product [Phytophthora lilii]
MLGSRQRATLAYRPQANGQQERSVQTVIRSVRAYVQTVDQSDWDEIAEKLMWALNTSYDFTRLDTPYYLVHCWDAPGTVQAMMGDVPRDVQLQQAYEWRLKVQRQVEYARAWARDLQAKAKTKRAREHNQRWKQLSDQLKEGCEVSNSVWLITEKGSDFRYQLQVEGTDYKFYAWVHVSRLKPRVMFPERPTETMDIPEDDDFDASYAKTAGNLTRRLGNLKLKPS